MAIAQPTDELAGLFNLPIAAFEVHGSGNPDWLLPDERAQCDRMGPGRIAEYAAGRVCARLAITELGGPTQPLLSGDDRPPIWPDGFHGSISHSRDYCTAVAARLAELGGSRIGIDAEQVGRVHQKLWRRLFTAPEIGHLQTLADPTLSATVMFSVKEAYYKAQYPITGAWVGFEDVRVEWIGNGLRLHPVTSLPALSEIEWPIDATFVRNVKKSNRTKGALKKSGAGDDSDQGESVVVTGVQAQPAS